MQIVNDIGKRIFKKIMFHKFTREFEIFTDIDFLPFSNIRPSKIEKICFVIPAIQPYSGGVTSILRLATYLSKFGFDITYVSYENQTYAKFHKNALTCLNDYNGKYMLLDDANNDTFDVVIATTALSMYYAKKIKGYKMAFVQDYEPLFYEAGDYHLLAVRAYSLGYHMVSLGGWNRYMIHNFIDNKLQVDAVSFPYEKKEYEYKQRNYADYKTKKNFRLCVYMRNTPRRLPGLLQIFVKKLQENFKKDGKSLDVFYFGEDIGKYKYGKNLGKLSKTELSDLYGSCDFGMVASYTNISLVPYEMLATGLPLIEVYDGSFRFFFSEEDAFLYDLDDKKLYREIKESLRNPQILELRNDRVQKMLAELSWENTAHEFETILKSAIMINRTTHI